MCCIRVEFELLKLLDIVGYIYCEEYCSMGPRGCFYPYLYQVIDIGTGFYWVELPVQRILCPIFMRNVGSPDIHECFHELTGSQRPPGFGASHRSTSSSVRICGCFFR